MSMVVRIEQQRIRLVGAKTEDYRFGEHVLPNEFQESRFRVVETDCGSIVDV